MTAQKRFINFRHDGSHVTSRARRCDVTEIKKLFLSNSNHIVLANFGVRYDSRLVKDVLYKKFTKLLTDPRRFVMFNYIISLISYWYRLHWF